MTSLVFWPFLTYLPSLSYSITSLFGGLSWTPLPTLIWDVTKERFHCYFVLLSFDKSFWRRKTQLTAFWKESGWWKFATLEQLLFINNIFLEGSTLNFSYTKKYNSQMKTGQNNKCDITLYGFDSKYISKIKIPWQSQIGSRWGSLKYNSTKIVDYSSGEFLTIFVI